jgi:hypothetical protein
MSGPLLYPDQPDDNLAEFFLRLIGTTLKKSALGLLVWVRDFLP